MDELLALLHESLTLETDIGADTPLLSSGLVDSFDVVGLIGVLEDHYGVEIDPADVDASSFDTPAQILARLVSTSQS